MYVYYRFNSSIHQSLTRIDVLGSLWAWDAANRGMPAIYARPITTLPSPPGHSALSAGWHVTHTQPIRASLELFILELGGRSPFAFLWLRHHQEVGLEL